MRPHYYCYSTKAGVEKAIKPFEEFLNANLHPKAAEVFWAALEAHHEHFGLEKRWISRILGKPYSYWREPFEVIAPRLHECSRLFYAMVEFYVPFCEARHAKKEDQYHIIDFRED